MRNLTLAPLVYPLNLPNLNLNRGAGATRSARLSPLRAKCRGDIHFITLRNICRPIFRINGSSILVLASFTNQQVSINCLMRSCNHKTRGPINLIKVSMRMLREEQLSTTVFRLQSTIPRVLQNKRNSISRCYLELFPRINLECFTKPLRLERSRPDLNSTFTRGSHNLSTFDIKDLPLLKETKGIDSTDGVERRRIRLTMLPTTNNPIHFQNTRIRSNISSSNFQLS